MRNDIKDTLDADQELARLDAADGAAATVGQAAESAEWDFWDSEYWIVRDRPPYRV